VDEVAGVAGGSRRRRGARSRQPAGRRLRPTYSYDSNTRLKLEAKDHMRARGVKSPDEWDAVALTFAEPVAPDAGFSRRLAYPASGVA
jgi:hypothetical protein